MNQNLNKNLIKNQASACIMDFSLANLIDIFKDAGLLIESRISDSSAIIRNLLTDSRNLHQPDGTLFFAIKTPGGNDGHRYIHSLYNQGVRNFVVEYIPEELKNVSDINLIISGNVLEALSLAGASQRKNASNVVAITGSKGKTTLKELIYQLLNPLVKICRSPRSYNSKIGVPLSLWEIEPETDYAIIEAGISQKGEMKNLSRQIAPDIVILTNIGEEHDEGFSSREEKVMEKASLAIPGVTRLIIYNADDHLIKKVTANINPDIRRIGWSFSDSGANLFLRKVSDNSLEYVWQGKPDFLEINAESGFEYENIASALALVLSQCFDIEKVKSRIKEFHTIETRLKVSEGINGCSLILDSFPSDISSLPPALDFIRRRKTPSQKITLLMSEPKDFPEPKESVYQRLARLLKEFEVIRFIGIGKEFKNYSEFFPDGTSFYATISDFRTSNPEFKDEIILLKGDREFSSVFEQLESRKHETVLEINLDALISNYNYFRRKVPSETGIIAMVKASGYGVGSFEIAKSLQDAGAAYLAVAVIDEGIELRRRGITMPIMVMNPRSANYLNLFSYRLEPEIYSFSLLREIISEAKKNSLRDYPVHLKLDTGMHRMGFIESEFEELLGIIKDSDEIKISSIFSHLATADCLDMDDFTLRQLNLFGSFSDKIITGLGDQVRRHILNSAGILRFPEYHYDFVRLGIGLYGANTLPPEIEAPLSTVATLKTLIISIHEWEPDQTIGYGGKGKLKRRSRIATIPIGYADGMNRHFGNGNISVFINGKEAPTIGNICMDASMIDVTGIECEEGDTVEIFGKNLSLQRLADHLGTIPYEILTSVSPRVKRIYYRE